MRALSSLALIACLVSPADGRASGFLLYEHSAAAQGMADARTAIADEPSAVWFNPAAIAQLPGVQLQVGLMGILPKTHYAAAGRPADPRTYPSMDPDGNGFSQVINDGENSVDAKLKGYTPPYLFATWDVLDSGVVVGLGINSPFGLGIYWPGDWDGRFIVTESDLVTIMTNPVVAVDLARLLGFADSLKLSLAAGYQAVWGEARMTQRIDLRIGEVLTGGAAQNPWGEMTLTGDGWAHGFNLALYAEWPGQVAVGLSFRSQMDLGLSGTARFHYNPAGTLAKDALGLQLAPDDRTGGRVSLALPMHINAGVAYLGIENLKLAADIYYAFWRSYDELAIEFACLDEGTCADLAMEPIPADWEDAFQLGFGAEYSLFGWIPVRAGFAHITRAVPSETYDPSLPDGPRNQICAGFGFRGDWWQVDLAYMYIWWRGTKDNDVGGWDEARIIPGGKANGTYTTTTHMLGASFVARI